MKIKNDQATAGTPIPIFATIPGYLEDFIVTHGIGLIAAANYVIVAACTTAGVLVGIST